MPTADIQESGSHKRKTPGHCPGFSKQIDPVTELSAHVGHATAIFRQVNKDELRKHHDALEFPDGRIVLLTKLSEGQEAIVLQLPAKPKTAAEADAQKRVTYVS